MTDFSNPTRQRRGGDRGCSRAASGRAASRRRDAGPERLDAIPGLLAAAPETKILMLSMQDDQSYVRQAFSAGVHGYLLKDAADVDPRALVSRELISLYAGG
jgi:hypothetical protein